MLANSPTGVVQDIIADDWGGSRQIDDAIRNFVQVDQLGCACLFHLLADQRQVGFEIEFVRAHQHRIAAGRLAALRVDILASERLLETVGVDAANLLAMMDEGKAVGIVDADDDILGMAAFKIAKGGVGPEGADVLHVAEHLLILASHGEGIERMLGAAEIGTPKGKASQSTRLTGRLMVIEGNAMAEIPVERRNQQRALLPYHAEDGIEEGIAVEALAIAHGCKHQLHDVGGQQYDVALLESPVLRQIQITNVRHTFRAWR